MDGTGFCINDGVLCITNDEYCQLRTLTIEPDQALTGTRRLLHTVCLPSNLVDPVELCHRGAKRSREEVLAAMPPQAVLSLSPGSAGWHSGSRNPPLIAGLAVPGRSEWAAPPLDQARVHQRMFHAGAQAAGHERNRWVRSGSEPKVEGRSRQDTP